MVELLRKIVLIPIAALILGAASAIACSCMPPSGDLDRDIRFFYRASTAVFEARAVLVTNHPQDEAWSEESSGAPEIEQRVQWKVERTWKGPHQIGSELTTRTIVIGNLCGVSVDEGDVYLIYVQRQEPYELSECSPTAPLAEAGAHVPILDRVASEQMPARTHASTNSAPPSN